jgi:two-component system phosphate regulon response regulator PhoB
MVEGAGPILIVDDEEDLLALIDVNLRREGFTTVKARNGREALEQLDAHRPSLVLLDLMLPDMSGTEVCRRIRSHKLHATTPVIMLTSRGEEIDRVVGFEVGADDYVVKANLSQRELVLRVRAVLRRRAEPEPAVQAPVVGPIVLEGLRIDDDAHRVFVDGAEVPLTSTEFKLLLVLARRAGRVQTRGMLLEDVWNMPPDLNTRTVDTHVKRLREKLGTAGVLVETVRGVGYRFNATGYGAAVSDA